MKQVKSEHSPIVYYVSRTGRPEWVLFLHAAFVDHNMFREQFEYFEGKYNLLAVDLIGHGRSTETRRGDTIDRMAEWIAEILKAEEIEKIHVVGVSLGAVIAQDFANRCPDRVSSLACFGGYDINNFDPETQKENGAKQRGMMLTALVSVEWFAKENRKISAYTAGAQEEFFRMNRLFPKKSFRFLASLGGMVNRYKTGERKYPLLIGCGSFDLPMESELIKAWKSREPDCTAVIFENAGHCVNMDVPQEFNQKLEEFWEGAKQ